MKSQRLYVQTKRLTAATYYDAEENTGHWVLFGKCAFYLHILNKKNGKAPNVREHLFSK